MKVMKFYLALFFLFSTSVYALDGEVLSKDNCASCHEDSSLNLISLSSMTYYSQSELLNVLQEGKMKQQAQHLSVEQKEALAQHLSKGEGDLAKTNANDNYCKKGLSEDSLNSNSNWFSWGYDAFNSRNQTNTNINSGNIKELKLKWSFGIGSQEVRAQPIVIGELVFISGSDTLYALDKENGCLYWEFQSKARLRNAPAVDTINKDALYLVDRDFNISKINALDGKLIWTTKIPKEYESNTSSASPVHVGNYLLVPISTHETVFAIDPTYECCKTSGGMAALDSSTGEIIWNHRMLEEAQFTEKGLITRVKKFAPSGAAVWNAPGVDIEEGRVFFGTGQSTQSPASEFSDAIISLNIKTGEKLWTTQTLSGDAHNVGCEIPVIKRMTCPEENGPDFDFGASVIQAIDKKGNKALFAGQKSGWVFRLNTSTGRIEWKTRVGRGGTLGGIHFGMSTDNDRLYVPVSDREVGREYDIESKPGLYALDFDEGKILWSYKLDDICKDRKPLVGEGVCSVGFSAPISVARDVLYAGTLDGRFSAHSTVNGNKLWEFDTLRDYQTVNGNPAAGGSIDAAGPVIVDDWVFINSGYSQHGQLAGNVILAFSIK
jgi:polyvinyl alcohol dehydrogenase (cytochrome)